MIDNLEVQSVMILILKKQARNIINDVERKTPLEYCFVSNHVFFIRVYAFVIVIVKKNVFHYIPDTL